jgi:hypothetical protein
MLWRVPQISRGLCWKNNVSDAFFLCCQFCLLKSCLLFIGTINLLSDPPHTWWKMNSIHLFIPNLFLDRWEETTCT